MRGERNVPRNERSAIAREKHPPSLSLSLALFAQCAELGGRKKKRIERSIPNLLTRLDRDRDPDPPETDLEMYARNLDLVQQTVTRMMTHSSVTTVDSSNS